MIPIPIALELKQAGLQWEPQTHDFFAIPDRGFDDQVFVLSELMASQEKLQGAPAITFHGTPEWALDYIWPQQVTWLPTEAQLRTAIETRLADEPGKGLQLLWRENVYTCRLTSAAGEHHFTAVSATLAYGRALLHLLQTID